MQNSRIQFSETLRTVRKSANLTQREMAQKIGVSRSSYTYSETGHVQPDITTLVKICQILEVSADSLLGLC